MKKLFSCLGLFLTVLLLSSTPGLCLFQCPSGQGCTGFLAELPGSFNTSQGSHTLLTESGVPLSLGLKAVKSLAKKPVSLASKPGKAASRKPTPAASPEKKKNRPGKLGKSFGKKNKTANSIAGVDPRILKAIHDRVRELSDRMIEFHLRNGNQAQAIKAMQAAIRRETALGAAFVMASQGKTRQAARIFRQLCTPKGKKYHIQKVQRKIEDLIMEQYELRAKKAALSMRIKGLKKILRIAVLEMEMLTGRSAESFLKGEHKVGLPHPSPVHPPVPIHPPVPVLPAP